MATGAARDVSRETEADLQRFATLVEQWNPRINLVSKASLSALWERHIWDSAQVFDLAGHPVLWLDIGSGGGFPALVCAILAKHEAPRTQFVLVESDQRKCVFLREAARQLDLPVRVEAKRIESLAPVGAGLITARALAPLGELLAHAQRHLAPGGIALFPKGKTWRSELAEAQERWSMRTDSHTSRTEPDAVILQIGDIAHV
ncbi:16S rRNA (guanine(527)-N(7))-methyltransferase RsmG [Roseivivax sp. CAU 1761]